MNGVLLLLARIMAGEPLRRPTPAQARRWAAIFAVIPICIAPMALVHKYLDLKNIANDSSAFTIVVSAAVFVIVIYYLTEVWAAVRARKGFVDPGISGLAIGVLSGFDQPPFGLNLIGISQANKCRRRAIKEVWRWNSFSATNASQW